MEVEEHLDIDMRALFPYWFPCGELQSTLGIVTEEEVSSMLEKFLNKQQISASEIFKYTPNLQKRLQYLCRTMGKNRADEEAIDKYFLDFHNPKAEDPIFTNRLPQSMMSRYVMECYVTPMIPISISSDRDTIIGQTPFGIRKARLTFIKESNPLDGFFAKHFRYIVKQLPEQKGEELWIRYERMKG